MAHERARHNTRPALASHRSGQRTSAESRPYRDGLAANTRWDIQVGSERGGHGVIADRRKRTVTVARVWMRRLFWQGTRASPDGEQFPEGGPWVALSWGRPRGRLQPEQVEKGTFVPHLVPTSVGLQPMSTFHPLFPSSEVSPSATPDPHTSILPMRIPSPLSSISGAQAISALAMIVFFSLATLCDAVPSHHVRSKLSTQLPEPPTATSSALSQAHVVQAYRTVTTAETGSHLPSRVLATSTLGARQPRGAESSATRRRTLATATPSGGDHPSFQPTPSSTPSTSPPLLQRPPVTSQPSKAGNPTSPPPRPSRPLRGDTPLDNDDAAHAEPPESPLAVLAEGLLARMADIRASKLVAIALAATLLVRCRVSAAFERAWQDTHLAVSFGQV